MEQRVRVAAALADGVSMRGVERLTGVTRQTVAVLLLSLGEGASLVHGTHMRDLPCDVLQMDEVWAFIGTKEGHKSERHPEEFGDAYTFVALDATSRAVVSYLTDKRTAAATVAFAADIRARVPGKPQLNSDGFIAYPDAIERAFGTQVHYAKNLKTYALDEAGGASRDDVRYSRGRCVASQKVTVFGAPDEDKVTTAHVERNNLTTRMWCRRLTRLTTCFSRRLVFLRAAMAWHFAVYNFTRVCASLRVTPAMQLGVTDRVWSIEELVAASLAAREALPPAVPPIVPPTPARQAGAVIRAARRAKAHRGTTSTAAAHAASDDTAVAMRRSGPVPSTSSATIEAARLSPGVSIGDAFDVATAPPETQPPGQLPDTFPPPPDAASDFRWLW